MIKQRTILFLTLFVSSLFTFWGCSDQGLFSSKDSGTDAFEGKVTYSLDFDLPPKRQRMASMYPEQELVYLKEGKSRLQRQLGMGLLTTLIYDPAKDSMFQLLDPQGSMGGRIDKTRIPIPVDSNENNIEYTEETDTLEVLELTHKEDGTDSSHVEYPVKKAVLKDTMNETPIEMPVWFTESLQGEPFRQFKGLKGLPLKFKSEANGFKVEKEVRTIEHMSVPDSLFDSNPNGYSTMSREELQQMIQGGGR